MTGWEEHRPVRVDAEVLLNAGEGPVNRRLRLRVRGWPGFAPGQFAMLSAGALSDAKRTDPLLPRPMAIYRASGIPAAAEVEILYKVAGRGTSLLAEALAGQSVSIVAPLGRAFPPPAAGQRVLIAAGGTGIASVYELAARLAPGQPVEVLLGARTRTELMALDDFEGLGVTLRLATDDGSAGFRGLVTELLAEALGSSESGGSTQVYSCGPTPMMRRCAEICADAGVGCVAALENHMACGFGVCLGCATPRVGGGFALVCRDGPAFDASEIDWDRLA